MNSTTAEATKATQTRTHRYTYMFSCFTFCLFLIKHTSSHSLSHTVLLPTGVWKRDRQVPAHENLCFRVIRGEADGTNSEAAAARPTAPSGAENQDNFIVIISLPLSPSLQLMEEEKEEERPGGHKGGGEGEEKTGTKSGREKNLMLRVRCKSDAFEYVKNFVCVLFFCFRSICQH